MLTSLIESYIHAYNQKDVAGMLAVLHDDVRFENISNTSGPMTLIGKKAFGDQAAQMLSVFSIRKQEIVNQIVTEDQAAVEISYSATVAQDLPNGWTASQQITLRGVSIFDYKDGKICRIADYS